MKRIFLFIMTAIGMPFLTNVGCAKGESRLYWTDGHQQRLSNNTEAPTRELPLEDISGVQFGLIQMGGTNCEIRAGETAIIERDALHLPDFLSQVSLTSVQDLKRGSCNLSIPFQTSSHMGFVVTGVELTQERLLSKGSRLRLIGEAFIAGQKGANFDEALLSRRSDLEELQEQKLYKFEQPLVVCGKLEGILRLNLAQVLDREFEGVASSSRLSNLRLLYAPIDCRE